MRKIMLALIAALALPAHAGPLPAAPYVPPYVSALQRAPRLTDDVTVGCVVGANWIYGGRAWTAQSCAAGQAHWVPITSVALPMDAVPGATVYGWGTRKLRAAYAGNALTLSDTASHTQAVGFLADGSLDGATTDAFNATYAANAPYVSTWNEQSTSAYSATAASAGTAPVATAANIVGNARSVVFNSVVVTITNQTQVNKYLTFPTLAWTPSASTLFVVANQRNTIQTRSVLETPSSARVILSSFQAASVASKIAFTGGKGGCNLVPETGPSVLGIDWNGTSTTCADNATSSTGASSTDTATTGGDLGSASSSYPATMDAAAVVLFPTALSATNFATEILSLEVLFNIQPQGDTVLAGDGDSTFAGTGTLQDNSIMKFALPLLSRPVRFYNMAIHGQTMCGSPNSMSNRAGYQFGNVYSATARDFVIHIMGGENDFRAGTTAATVEACLQTYVSTVKALGANVRVVVAIEPLKCDILLNSTELAAQQAYDAWILANAFVPQSSGGLGLVPGNDAIDNLHADPVVGPNTYAASAFCNAPTGTTGSYPNADSPDGIHMLDALAAAAAVPVAASVNAVLH